MKVNINDYVKVKLTDRGRKILKQQHEEINTLCGGGLPEFSIKIDENGYTKFQLHDLMERFGSYMTMGFELVFETNIIIDD